MSFLPLLRAWIWISACASAAGWLLSALGILNYAGYAIFFAIVALIFIVGKKLFGWQPGGFHFAWPKFRKRFTRWLPLCFAALALLVFLGGALYPPTNHAAFTYRTPRVLHWLAEGRWYWIHTPNYRMNNRACGFEWLTAPLLLFTKSDRSLFLINFVAFLLLPGLVYSVFTRLGVRPRVAWCWMWLLPTGYNFLLQAGSVANDTFPTVYAMAALDFGLRTWKSRRFSDLALSILSASLLIGAKASNLPLLLPWAVLIAGLVPLIFRRPGTTLLLALVCATVSFIPNAILNAFYCGDWSGLNLEQTGMDMKNPIVGLWGNCLLLAKNFVPPFFPQASWWNDNALKVLPHFIVGPMVANFEQGFHVLGELPTEDGTGIGFGLSVLLVISIVAAAFHSKKIGGSATLPPAARWIPNLVRWGALLAPWGSLLFYCLKSGIVDATRLISPYYPMLFPLLLLGTGEVFIVQKRWWKVLAFCAVLLAFPVIILTPGRPLWPAQTILEKLHERKPGQRLIARAQKVYSVYAGRSDPLANVRALLPPGLKIVGFMGTGDDIDISLWRPYGSRRVEHILLNDSLEDIKKRNIEYAVIGGYNLGFHGTTLEEWQKRTGARVIAQTTATLTVIQGPQSWYVVQFPD